MLKKEKSEASRPKRSSRFSRARAKMFRLRGGIQPQGPLSNLNKTHGFWGAGKLPKLIVIVGPNASGKSDLAVRIAKKVRLQHATPSSTPHLHQYFDKSIYQSIASGEIISADSRQVYRGMDIGTGKVPRDKTFTVQNSKFPEGVASRPYGAGKTQNSKFYHRGVPHHLLDVASPKSDFNVSHFKKLATQKIEEIVGRGRVPIIVGGTGMWIDALIYDWPIPNVGPNRALRARLEKWPAARLFAKLQKLDSVRARAIKARNELNNKRRLIRALEIVIATGKPMPEFNVAFKYDRGYKRQKIGGREYEVLILGLGVKLPQKELEKRIRARLLTWLKQGMIDEIKKLHDSGVSWKRLDNFGLEYRFGSRYLRGLLTYDEMVDQTYQAIRKYAKRQMTWFKRNTNIKWFSKPEGAVILAQKFIA